MQQWRKDTIFIVIMVIIANIQQMTRNMSAELVHLKAFLLVLLNSVNMLNLTRIERILEIIEQELRVHQVHKVQQVLKESQEFGVYKVQ